MTKRQRTKRQRKVWRYQKG